MFKVLRTSGWLNKENQYDFRKYPKIKWLYGGLEPQPLDCRQSRC